MVGYMTAQRAMKKVGSMGSNLVYSMVDLMVLN